MRLIIIVLGIIASFALLSVSKAAPTASSTPSGQFSALISTSTLVQTSDPIVRKLSEFSPQVGSIATPLFAAIDAGRFAVERVLQNQIESTGTRLPGTAILKPVSGKDGNHLTWQGALQSIIGVLWTVYFFVLVIVRFVIAKIVLFYPIFTIAIVLIVVRAYQWWRD